MIPNTCIVIKTDKFPILEGEDEEIVNEGMYGKALCMYLEEKIPTIGLEAPFYCNEDWGWWFEVKEGEFTLPLCIYSDPEGAPEVNPKQYVILSSITNETKWSWRKFRKVNVSKSVTSIMDAVEELFLRDSQITEVKRLDEYPF